ncbi:hypothetical protein [Flavobacterium sp.]|jgi:hypothetical protein|uniref:hypothetical protein n=1 Tax=Flavobacterium sp. TaxID=239 RepID=UPI0037BFCD85
MYKRTKLTGYTSYRKTHFRKLVLTVEVAEQARPIEPGGRFGYIPPFPPPPGHPDPAKYIAEQNNTEEQKWRTVRKYLRDATEEDMQILSRNKEF